MVPTKISTSNEMFTNLDSFRQDLRKNIINKIKSSSKTIEMPSQTKSEGLSALLSNRFNERVLPVQYEIGSPGLKSSYSSNFSVTPVENPKKKFELHADTIFTKKTSKDSGINNINNGISKSASSSLGELADLLNKKRGSTRTSFNGKDSTISKSIRIDDIFASKLKSSNQESPSRK